MKSILTAALIFCLAAPVAQAQTKANKLFGAKSTPTQQNPQASSPEPIIYYGNDKQVKMPAKRKPVKMVGEDVSLNFENAPLEEVVHAIVGDILQLDYVIDHPIKGQVTLRTRTPVARAELLGVLESLLEANKVLMIRGKDNRYLISGSPQMTSPATQGS